jgi:hypothetical protein
MLKHVLVSAAITVVVLAVVARVPAIRSAVGL